jgi:hypothetical protein
MRENNEELIKVPMNPGSVPVAFNDRAETASDGAIVLFPSFSIRVICGQEIRGIILPGRIT